jgi:hypothetical protein
MGPVAGGGVTIEHGARRVSGVCRRSHAEYMTCHVSWAGQEKRFASEE